MRNSKEYLARLQAMNPNVYLNAQKVPRDDEQILPGIEVVCRTFDAINDPRYEGLAKVHSPIIGQEISRFCHIMQSSDDLLKKQKFIRGMCQEVGWCIQRCGGIDTLNALSVVTKLVDDKYATQYHQRFIKFMKYFQENDLVGAITQTDPKGDRSKRPHQQEDPDVYLRIVEKRKDGIVIRGAKIHNTNAPYADELVVVPTRAMTEQDEPWALAFSIPADWPGVKLILRSTSARKRKYLHAPIAGVGMSDSFTIFDDVFVPIDRVFLCGEWEFAGPLASLVATYHRHSYTGCKPGMADVMIGAAALVSDYNGIGKAPHVRDSLAELIATAELVYGAGMAAAMESKISSSGTCIPDIVFTNVARYHAGTNLYHEYEVLADLAGGLSATLPPEEQWYHPETRELMEKYIKRKSGISAESQHRLFRCISDMVCSSFGGVMQIAGLHGGGSPIMERIAITQQYDLEKRKAMAEYLAGISQEKTTI